MVGEPHKSQRKRECVMSIALTLSACATGRTCCVKVRINLLDEIGVKSSLLSYDGYAICSGLARHIKAIVLKNGLTETNLQHLERKKENRRKAKKARE